MRRGKSQEDRSKLGYQETKRVSSQSGGGYRGQSVWGKGSPAPWAGECRVGRGMPGAGVPFDVFTGTSAICPRSET